MEQLNNLFSQLEATIGIEAPYLKTAFKVSLTLVAFVVVWFILRVVLSFIERRIKTINLIEIQEALFKIFHKALLYALILFTGTYLIQLFNIPFGGKIFYAFFIVLFAGPIKNFLIVTIRYLQSRVAKKTESKIDDIVFDLLIRFSDFIVYTVAIIIALDMLGVNVMPFIAGAGVAGVVEVSAIAHRLQEGLAIGLGFSGIIVAWLAKLNPLYVILSAIFFAEIGRASCRERV